MTYQGARARPEDSEMKRVFAISAIRWDQAGHVGDVLWSEVNTGSNQNISSAVVVPVADVVDAIHDGAQVVAVFTAWPVPQPQHLLEVMERDDGGETIVLSRATAAAFPSRPDLDDMPALEGSSREARAYRPR